MKLRFELLDMKPFGTKDRVPYCPNRCENCGWARFSEERVQWAPFFEHRKRCAKCGHEMLRIAKLATVEHVGPGAPSVHSAPLRLV